MSVFASFLLKSKITCLFFSLQCAVDCSLATTPQDCSCPQDMNKKNTCTSTTKEGQVLARQQVNNKRKKINCLNTAELRFFLLIAPGNLWRFYHTYSFLEKKFWVSLLNAKLKSAAFTEALFIIKVCEDGGQWSQLLRIYVDRSIVFYEKPASQNTSSEMGWVCSYVLQSDVK